MKIKKKLLKTVNYFNMLSQGDKVIVALSGGPDSVGLLHLLKSLTSFKLHIVCAHFNHKLRGKESSRDAEFAESLSAKAGVKFEYGEADTMKYKSQKGLSTEDAARDLRYRFLEQVLKKHGADKIATAHTLDDQAETVLMRVIRGSGRQGLSGIPPVSGKLIRPLLEIEKAEIIEYLKSENIIWVEDSTNLSKDFLRNKIRLDLLPEIKKINPGITDVLSRSAEVSRLEHRFIHETACREFNKVIKKKGYGFVGRRKKFLSLDKSIRLEVLRESISKIKGDLKGVSATHLLSIDEMIESERPSADVTLPSNLRFHLGYGIFLICDKDSINRGFNHSIKGEGRWKFDGNLTVQLNTSEDKKGWDDEKIGFFSLKNVEYPLTIRSLKPGDRFKPLGAGGFKKVKDFLIDEKVPRFLRKSIPVLESRKGIIWVAGLRIDDRFKVRNDKKFLKIKVNKPELDLLKHI